MFNNSSLKLIPLPEDNEESFKGFICFCFYLVYHYSHQFCFFVISLSVAGYRGDCFYIFLVLTLYIFLIYYRLKLICI